MEYLSNLKDPNKTTKQQLKEIQEKLTSFNVDKTIPKVYLIQKNKTEIRRRSGDVEGC